MRQRQKNPTRWLPTRYLVAAAIVEMATAPVAVTAARADSGTTGYGGPGNVLNPTAQVMNRARDDDGLSIIDDVTRTPTGLMYPVPFRTPDMKQSQGDPDWWTQGWFEGGIMGTFGQDSRSAALNEYGDWKNGFTVTSLGFQAENRKTALHVSAFGQNVGRTDQYYQVDVGRYGVYDLQAYFDSIPHTYSTTAKSLWDGAGTGTLTLRGGLTPGGSTPAQVNAVAAAVGPSTLRILREKAGSSLTYTADEHTELFLKISDERRDGTQPISATFGYPFQNGATQLIQPIHYQTVDVSGGVRYKEQNFQANLAYAGSFFRNDILDLTWQNPGLTSNTTPGAYIPQTGRLSLAPNNDYHTVKGDLAVQLSPASRFTASLSYSLMRQDDELQAPTTGGGLITSGANTINLNQWNSTAALSQPSANAAINILNAVAQYHYAVSPDLGLTVEVRDRDEANHTNYVAYNPQTGQYGYIAIDGGLAHFIPSLSGIYRANTPGSLVQIRNMPFANNNLQVTAKAAYRLDTHWKLDLSYENDTIDHTVREIADAHDNIGRVQLSTTGYEWGTARLSYEVARRIGSDYQSNPYTPYYSSALPGYIPATPAGDPAFALADLRKFDVANRTEHALRGQANYILSPRSDLQLTGSLKVDDYDAAYGLRSTHAFDLTTAYTHQLSAATTLTGYFTYQNQDRGVANINATGSGTSTTAGGAGYPLANGWTETVGSDNYTLGLNAHHSWGAVSLNADYTFTRASTAIDYAFTSTGAFFNTLSAAQAGNSFPAITYDSHALQTDVRWQMSEELSYRLYYRFNYERVVDFHYTGLTAGAVNNNTYLGVIPENYTVQTIGLLVQYVF
ncbi:MtrB/PioB family outer membrane beta-barrel protein [Nitrospirillum iridis]|uniref:MtrB/PioB family decaheme-associated outer membrane protein n=1 Tax=Nitrospirillum iridis TaxID=765888 RepID=A0A7X0B1U1_9PROT|nr:MtrB/PioB family outer membrane beta-barrel protein [Nitrospirillum iridis]MBB6254212.1 MtrB/PioB family decaheme-associated outer membrane protein [Nitrospirillum iridis]